MTQDLSDRFLLTVAIDYNVVSADIELPLNVFLNK